MIVTFMYGRVSSEINMQYHGDTTVATFSVAVNRRGKDKGADFFRCKAFGKAAEMLEKFFRKGSRIALQATPTQPPKYENKDGVTVYPNVEFIVNTIDFVDTKAEQAPSQAPDGFMKIEDGLTVEEGELPFK